MALLSALGYTACAVVIGGALGLLRGPWDLAEQPAALLLPMLAAAAVWVMLSRVDRLSAFDQASMVLRVFIGLLHVLVMTALVLMSEAVALFDWPSAAGLMAGLGLGLTVTSAWMGAHAQREGLRAAVLLLYLAAAMVALSTLVTTLPASSFWVVSAMIPAWQSRRLALRGELLESKRLLHAATQVLAGVLTLAVTLPALLLYR